MYGFTIKIIYSYINIGFYSKQILCYIACPGEDYRIAHSRKREDVKIRNDCISYKYPKLTKTVTIIVIYTVIDKILKHFYYCSHEFTNNREDTKSEKVSQLFVANMMIILCASV